MRCWRVASREAFRAGRNYNDGDGSCGESPMRPTHCHISQQQSWSSSFCRCSVRQRSFGPPPLLPTYAFIMGYYWFFYLQLVFQHCLCPMNLHVVPPRLSFFCSLLFCLFFVDHHPYLLADPTRCIRTSNRQELVAAIGRSALDKRLPWILGLYNDISAYAYIGLSQAHRNCSLRNGVATKDFSLNFFDPTIVLGKHNWKTYFLLKH